MNVCVYIYIYMYTCIRYICIYIYTYVMDPATHVMALHAFIYCLHTRFSPSLTPVAGSAPPQPIGGVERRRMGPYNIYRHIIF